MSGSVAILAAALAAGQAGGPAASAPQTTTRVVPLGTLNIPDEVAPAVVPYLNCLYGSRGIEMRSRDGSALPSAVPAGTDCGPHRREAFARADRMLRTQGRGTRSERAAFIEAVLVRIEQFAGAMPLGGRPGAITKSDPPTSGAETNASDR